ncbi:MAG TPA: hypothetical protein VGF75_07065 [Candidatus Saccharimonadales bacterium]|jgi:hypothetical protein
MPRAPRKGPKKPAHRPLKPIDWDFVDERLEAGCLGTEIAPHFDMHPNTFYERTLLEKGVSFTEYSLQKKSKGESNLRYLQYKRALGETDRGDNTLLIWLGKNRLGQKESHDIIVSPETAKSFASVMDQLGELQKKRTADSE